MWWIEKYIFFSHYFETCISSYEEWYYKMYFNSYDAFKTSLKQAFVNLIPF